MDNNHSTTWTDTGLAPGYDDAPATFAVLPAVALPGVVTRVSQPSPVPGAVGGDTCVTPPALELVGAVRRVNQLQAEILRLEETAREAARRRLFALLSLGGLLWRLGQVFADAGVTFRALFADFKGSEEAQAAARVLTASGLIGFTYRTCCRYRRLYREARRRMEERLGAPEAQRALAEHLEGLVRGAFAAPAEELEQFWAPFVTASGLRQAYLELAPQGGPMTRVDEVLAAAAGEEGTTGQRPSWAEQRVRLCQQFGGFYSSLDTYIERMSMYTTRTDREAQAAQLEEAARRLRAVRTRSDLPGLPECRETRPAGGRRR